MLSDIDTLQELSGKLRYNFKNEESLRVLAKTLLKHDFDLDVDIPAEKLVPVMPLRLNYILWIEDLMAHAKFTGHEIYGIDIGKQCKIYIHNVLSSVGGDSVVFPQDY